MLLQIKIVAGIVYRTVNILLAYLYAGVKIPAVNQLPTPGKSPFFIDGFKNKAVVILQQPHNNH
jgi:hypothetical protein